MPPHLMPGLSTEAASHICMNQCKAMCCRGPFVLVLTPDEVTAFKDHAAKLDVDLVLSAGTDGGAWVRFMDHRGERCPMLDDATSACRIYGDRPQRCRDFPEKLITGCAISGG